MLQKRSLMLQSGSHIPLRQRQKRPNFLRWQGCGQKIWQRGLQPLPQRVICRFQPLKIFIRELRQFYRLHCLQKTCKALSNLKRRALPLNDFTQELDLDLCRNLFGHSNQTLMRVIHPKRWPQQRELQLPHISRYSHDLQLAQIFQGFHDVQGQKSVPEGPLLPLQLLRQS